MEDSVTDNNTMSTMWKKMNDCCPCETFFVMISKFCSDSFKPKLSFSPSIYDTGH